MNKTADRLIGIFLLGVFAFFYCGNTLFVHSHSLGDHMVVHSHPYIPSGHHTHTQGALDSLAGFNAALLSMEAGESAVIDIPEVKAVTIEPHSHVTKSESHPLFRQWRAPPVG